MVPIFSTCNADVEGLRLATLRHAKGSMRHGAPMTRISLRGAQTTEIEAVCSGLRPPGSGPFPEHQDGRVLQALARPTHADPKRRTAPAASVTSVGHAALGGTNLKKE